MSDQAKLNRLRRLERIRAIARQTALTEAAEAESTLARLADLAGRTRTLASDYATRDSAVLGADLRVARQFATGLHDILADTETNVTRARTIADHRQVALAAAERRRAVVEERADQAARAIAARGSLPPTGARRSGADPQE